MAVATSSPATGGSAATVPTLANFVLQEWVRQVPDAVVRAAEDIAGRYGDAAMAVLFYGSCLRTGEIEDRILDFYVLVDDYAKAFDKRWLAKANAILPPNVFYAETLVDGITVRSKYAVVSLADFIDRTRPACLNVSIWARFSQPCLLMMPRSPKVETALADAVAQSMRTMIGAILPLTSPGARSKDLWTTAFDHTYASELRSERVGKGLELYLLDQARYDQATPIVLAELGVATTGSGEAVEIAEPYDPTAARKAGRRWFRRRLNGKLVSFARLIKASFTFDGGIDYLAWKIRRHSGVEIEITPWRRRHPILAGLMLFFQLRKQGAFK